MYIDGERVYSYDDLSQSLKMQKPALRHRVRSIEIIPYHKEGNAFYFNKDQVDLIKDYKVAGRKKTEKAYPYQLAVVEYLNSHKNNGLTTMSRVLGIPGPLISRLLELYFKNGYVVMESKMNQLNEN